MPVDMVRTFIAIELGALLVRQLQELQAQLRERIQAKSARWCPKEQLHLTLKFLGNIPADQVDPVSAAIRRACEAREGFRLRAEGVGCFPSLARPSVIWVGIHGDVKPLEELKLRLDGEMDPLVGHREDRPFHPHVTLARIKNARPDEYRRIGEAIESAQAGRLGEWSVREIRFMRSDLSTQGARHSCLATVPLC